jgi:hypothetical protein
MISRAANHVEVLSENKVPLAALALKRLQQKAIPTLIHA